MKCALLLKIMKEHHISCSHLGRELGLSRSSVLRMLQRGTCSRTQQERLYELGFPREALPEVRGTVWPLQKRQQPLKEMTEKEQNGDDNAD